MTDRGADWAWRVAFLCAGSAVALAWPNAVKLLAAVAVWLFILAFAVVYVVIIACMLWLFVCVYYRATLAAVHGEYAKGLAVWLLFTIVVRGAWTSGGDVHWLYGVAFMVSMGIAISLADKGEYLYTTRRKGE